MSSTQLSDNPPTNTTVSRIRLSSISNLQEQKQDLEFIEEVEYYIIKHVAILNKGLSKNGVLYTPTFLKDFVKKAKAMRNDESKRVKSYLNHSWGGRNVIELLGVFENFKIVKEGKKELIRADLVLDKNGYGKETYSKLKNFSNEIGLSIDIDADVVDSNKKYDSKTGMPLDTNDDYKYKPIKVITIYSIDVVTEPSANQSLRENIEIKTDNINNTQNNGGETLMEEKTKLTLQETLAKMQELDCDLDKIGQHFITKSGIKEQLAERENEIKQLEEQVKERTNQIEIANNNIKEVETKLQEANTIIENKKAEIANYKIKEEAILKQSRLLNLLDTAGVSENEQKVSKEGEPETMFSLLIELKEEHWNPIIDKHLATKNKQRKVIEARRKDERNLEDDKNNEDEDITKKESKSRYPNSTKKFS